jgi:hypothetical protein
VILKGYGFESFAEADLELVEEEEKRSFTYKEPQIGDRVDPNTVWVSAEESANILYGIWNPKEDNMASRQTQARKIIEETIPELEGQIVDIQARISDLNDEVDRLKAYPTDDAEIRGETAKLVGKKAAKSIDALKKHGITVSITAPVKA